jgi:hypothetical protein
MAEAKPFTPVKLVCGIIFSDQKVRALAVEKLEQLYGAIDLISLTFTFDITDYYEKQMGKNLKREFVSFKRLISPESLSEIKLRTNQLEEEIRAAIQAERRVVNLDPGCLTSSALIMATAKNFAHRVPLQKGIYAHLELLLTRKEVRPLDWTYPDYKKGDYQKFFLDVRKIYLSQLSEL